jgi:hypothetical protein
VQHCLVGSEMCIRDSPTAVDSTPESKPSAPVASTPDAQPVTTVAPSATTSTASAIPSAATGVTIPSITGSSKPSFSSAPVATGGTTTSVSARSSLSSTTSMPVATGGSTTSVSSSTPVAPTSPQSKPATFGSAKYFTANASGTGNITQVNHSDTGSGWGIAGATDAHGRPIAFSKEGAAAFAKMMQDSNGIVKPSDVASSKRSIAKNAEVDGATNSPHLRGIAMDIHGTSNAWIRQNGYKYGWKPHDYSGTHGGHFIFGGAGITPLATPVVTLPPRRALSAIIKPGVPRDKEDYSKAIAAAAVQTNAEVAVTKTPKSSPVPPLPAPPNINKINGGGGQNSSTSADKNSVYYYLRRLGFQDLSTPEKALAI